MTGTRWRWPLSAALLGSILVLAPTAQPAPQDGAIRGRERQTSRSRRADQPGRYRGHVIPSRQVELRAPLEELLKAVEVSEGDQVGRGQLLARLDDRIQAAVVEAARLVAESESEVRAATLDLEEAQENERRILQAFERQAASDQETHHARIAVGRAEAARTAAVESRAIAGARLAIEEQRLSRYGVAAPFDGTVIRVMSEPGALLTAQDVILILADLGTLEANINIPATMYGQLTVGETYTLEAKQPVNGELTATLQSIEPIIDTASQTFRCVFVIDNEASRLPAGFTVSLRWPAQPAADPVVIVPDGTSQ